MWYECVYAVFRSILQYRFLVQVKSPAKTSTGCLDCVSPPVNLLFIKTCRKTFFVSHSTTRTPRNTVQFTAVKIGCRCLLPVWKFGFTRLCIISLLLNAANSVIVKPPVRSALLSQKKIFVVTWQLKEFFDVTLDRVCKTTVCYEQFLDSFTFILGWFDCIW